MKKVSAIVVDTVVTTPKENRKEKRAFCIRFSTLSVRDSVGLLALVLLG